MRGGVSIDHLLHECTNDDIEVMLDIIAENIETTQKAQMPLL